MVTGMWLVHIIGLDEGERVMDKYKGLISIFFGCP